ncbi:MAG: hypothetical protein WCD31_05790, partial [Gillisia sp.]
MKKCYVLIISEFFPKSHPRAGEDTWFYEKIINETKIHTIRKNFPLWEKRVKEINAGKAYLSVRAWSGKPYRSKQVELIDITEVGIERLNYYAKPDHFCIDGFETDLSFETLAKNDGLSLADFKAWFNPFPSGSMAVIHFTDFRYPVKDRHIQKIRKDCQAGEHWFEKWEKTGEDSGVRTHVQQDGLSECGTYSCV